MLCGIGAGKSHTGAAWLLKKYLETPNSVGLITANTYGQLQKATLSTIFRILGELEIPFDYNQGKAILTINGKKKFFCLSLDNYDVHRGIEIGEWFGDEVAYNDVEAFNVMSGRLRDKRGKLDVLFASTPKGLNWLYDYFAPTGSKYNPDLFRTIHAKTTDNIYLPKEYIETLRKQYDSKLAKQELDAEWINIAQGQAYYQFNRDVIGTTIRNSSFPVFAFTDFNVNPLCSVIAQYYQDHFYVLDEIYLTNSNTQELARAIKAKGASFVIPDSTGKNRKTTGPSDFIILENEGLQIIDTHNPRVIDRVNNVNRILEQQGVTIDKRCVKLIADLEQVTWRDNKFELDQTTNKMLTHISDALGYGMYKLAPMGKVGEIRMGKIYGNI